MNILTIGFGNMGCRHTQSMMNSFPEASFFVLEPNDQIFEANCLKIGVLPKQLRRINTIDELSEYINFVVVATSAFPRYELVSTLLQKGIEKFLVEKVVFQSERQFDDITKLAKKKGAKIYCNFVNRYFPTYQRIKLRLNKLPLSMVVLGGDFGLGCNALHYVDLFEYLTGNSSRIKASRLVENKKENRRGNIYREVLGQLMWETTNGDRLLVIADDQNNGGNEIIMEQDGRTEVLNEETLKHYSFYSEQITLSEFSILYTSSLTGVILKDIMEDRCILPTIEETKNYHVQFFNAINPVFGLEYDELCPIT